jgi:NAD(P)-dependent dehydrogenase (short-subunit alcohol dehydrogenase family)
VNEHRKTAVVTGASNSAGIFLVKPFVELTVGDIEQQIATNLKGVIRASQKAART